MDQAVGQLDGLPLRLGQQGRQSGVRPRHRPPPRAVRPTGVRGGPRIGASAGQVGQSGRGRAVGPRTRPRRWRRSDGDALWQRARARRATLLLGSGQARPHVGGRVAPPLREPDALTVRRPPRVLQRLAGVGRADRAVRGGQHGRGQGRDVGDGDEHAHLHPSAETPPSPRAIRSQSSPIYTPCPYHTSCPETLRFPPSLHRCSAR